MGLLVDGRSCSGCRACELACAWEHFRVTNPRKAALRIVSLVPAEPGFRIRICNQCGSCVDACPLGAIYREGEAYRINERTCTGCGICVESCPEEAIFPIPGRDAPVICDLCGRCVEKCPTGALTWSSPFSRKPEPPLTLEAI